MVLEMMLEGSVVNLVVVVASAVVVVIGRNLIPIRDLLSRNGKSTTLRHPLLAAGLLLLLVLAAAVGKLSIPTKHDAKTGPARHYSAASKFVCTILFLALTPRSCRINKSKWHRHDGAYFVAYVRADSYFE